jgi:DNA-3-methyladenine glycosylase II
VTAVSFTPRGPFSLAASTAFLEGFTPASYDDAPDGVLRLAFPADDGRTVIGCAVRQKETAGHDSAPVHADYIRLTDDNTTTTRSATGAVRAQIARILSLDIDATHFPALGKSDSVVANLQAEFPGLRPVLFYSPYEAAAWTIIGNRIRMEQAARIKDRIAKEYGHSIDVAGRKLHAFPTPDQLRCITVVPGLTATKIARLHALAYATEDGLLDPTRLRDQPPELSLSELKKLPGIGTFSAELILIRGVGHPDVFPTAEPRVAKAMAAAYGLDPATAHDLPRLSAIAETWRPYRSWVTLLLRTHAQESA